MLIRTPGVFGIQTLLSEVWQRQSFQPLGSFRIWLGSQPYGVWTWNASMLGNSFDAVGERLALRGSGSGLASEPFSGGQLMRAYRAVCYDGEPYPAGSTEAFASLGSNPAWAPDGDEAFDDSSYVLHLDLGESVRLIGARVLNDRQLADEKEIRMPADEFYGHLEAWRAWALEAWNSWPHPRPAEGEWTEAQIEAAEERWHAANALEPTWG